MNSASALAAGSFQTLNVRHEGAVLLVEISAPPMNLLGPDLVRDLVSLIQQAEADSALRVLVFKSAAPDYFISHVDVTRIDEYRQEAAKLTGEASIGLLFRHLSTSRLVTIAQIEGRIRGAGSEFVLACDMRLEVVVIPVSDVECTKMFYSKLGWRPDADFSFDNGFRVVQFTPPGSGCSIQFGTKVTRAAPGSAQGLYLIVSDIEAARAELVAHGIEISEVFHPMAPGAQFQSSGTSDRVSGPASDHASYGSFATFSDPDGNGWLLQEITTRLPAGSTPHRPHSQPQRIWQTRCGVRRPRTASMKSASGSGMQTGPTGTPTTWCANNPENRCRSKHS